MGHCQSSGTLASSEARLVYAKLRIRAYKDVQSDMCKYDERNMMREPQNYSNELSRSVKCITVAPMACKVG